ncbi:hypothetical protein ACN261_31560 [Micromonospora sp. WMMD723]|uniref:hypothetical protein n=1 Tax=Micromonospora sp. WMMD723 TaxID=3403465 RepID=UPI003CF735A0
MARQRATPAAAVSAVDELPEGPVPTEPGCTHPGCVLEHPHDGPAVLTTPPPPAPGQAGDVDGHDQAAQRVVDAQAALDAAREDAAARLPGAGYVIATQALHVAGGARAHLAGDRVPVGNVVRNGWEHLVRSPVDDE